MKFKNVFTKVFGVEESENDIYLLKFKDSKRSKPKILKFCSKIKLCDFWLLCALKTRNYNKKLVNFKKKKYDKINDLTCDMAKIGRQIWTQRKRKPYKSTKKFDFQKNFGSTY